MYQTPEGQYTKDIKDQQLKHERMAGYSGQVNARKKKGDGVDVSKMYRAVASAVERKKSGMPSSNAEKKGYNPIGGGRSKGGNPYGPTTGRPTSDKTAEALAAMARQRRG